MMEERVSSMMIGGRIQLLIPPLRTSIRSAKTLFRLQIDLERRIPLQSYLTERFLNSLMRKSCTSFGCAHYSVSI